MKRVLLIDNYDSFTYNLLQYLRELGAAVLVYKNDQISVDEAVGLAPDFLVFSPGPGTVECKADIGNGLKIFEAFQGKIPILGVCLGHQMIGQYYGGKIAKVEPRHGRRWPIRILDKTDIFAGLPDEIVGMRYHSLVIQHSSVETPWQGVSTTLKITAKTTDKDQHIMAISKPDQHVYGVQFHPESIGTKWGLKILENFLNLCCNE